MFDTSTGEERGKGDGTFAQRGENKPDEKAFERGAVLLLKLGRGRPSSSNAGAR